MNTKNYLPPTKKYRTLISAVHSVYRVVNATFQVKDMAIRLAKLICHTLNSSCCTIILLDGTKKYSALRCMISSKKRVVIDKKTRISGGMEKKIIKTLVSIRKDNLLALPLVCEDIIGMVIVKRNNDEPGFEKFEQEVLMTVIEQAIMGIRNLQLYEEQQKILFGSIRSLVNILDMRVPSEYTHSPYFSKLVVAIAHQMHLDEKQAESLKYASMLHDAGKADIPLEILTKSTKLTRGEYNIIKKHPLSGAQILRPMQILKPVVQIITHHHEKFNGTGYPSKLKGNQIPEGARIMAVADAFEAMVYGRPYRERMDIHSAIKEIKKKSGTQFDPRIVDAFLRAAKKMSFKQYLPR